MTKSVNTKVHVEITIQSTKPVPLDRITTALAIRGWVRSESAQSMFNGDLVYSFVQHKTKAVMRTLKDIETHLQGYGLAPFSYVS